MPKSGQGIRTTPFVEDGRPSQSKFSKFLLAALGREDFWLKIPPKL